MSSAYVNSNAAAAAVQLVLHGHTGTDTLKLVQLTCRCPAALRVGAHANKRAKQHCMPANLSTLYAVEALH
jgi:hypothetical protein